MKFFLAALALVAVGANAQSATTTISAPCGTSCPSAPADKIITRSAAPMETSPCPSLIVSSVAMNGSGPGTGGAPAPTASPSAFTGAASHVGGPVAAVVAAAAFAFAL